MGAAARPWHWAGYSHQFKGRAANRAWLDLPRPASLGKPWLAGFGMEDVGGKPPGEVLQANSSRQKQMLEEQAKWKQLVRAIARTTKPIED
jgi:hypothetical protein